MSWLPWLRSRRWAVFLTALLLAGVGVWRALTLPSAVFPSVTFPIVKVITDVGEEPAARMMPTVTRPLEEAILRVPGIERVISTTSRGSTEMSAIFSWGVDMNVALQRVQAETERVRPTLPTETRIDVEWMNTAIYPIEGYALTSDTLSQAELWDLAQYTLKPALIRIPGVSEIQIQGGRQREFQVRLDPAALIGFKMTAADVVAAIKSADDVSSAGLHEANHELYLTLIDGRATSLAELRKLAVATPGGLAVSLEKLGTVDVADEVSYVRTSAQGKPAVLLNVIRQPAGNIVAIADAIDALMRTQKLLPRGVEWTRFYDEARFVRDSVNGVRDALWIGIGLAAVVLLLFLRNLRLMLVAAIAMPVTAAIAGLLLDATGQTINLMTLAGLAASLGLVADDAIVVVENIARHRERGAADAVAIGLREILPALIASGLGSIAILIPFALLTGVTGAFFKPVALTLGIALAVSFAVSAFVVPLVSDARAHTKASKAWRLTRRVRIGFRGAVRRFVAWPWLGALCALALLAGAWVLERTLGSDFLPEMDEGSIILDYWSPPGTSLTDTDAMLRNAEREILALPDVRAYSRRTGAQLGFFITEPNRGDYVIDLKPRAERRPVDEVIEDLRARFARVAPALHTDFGQLLEDNIGDLSGGAVQPIDLKLFGNDATQLEAQARRVAGLLARIDGLADVFDGIVIAGPALDFRVDPLAAARLGVDAGAIHEQVEPFVEGTVVHPVRVGERLFDLRVLVRGGALAETPVRGKDALVPLSSVATLKTGAPEAEIDRENLRTFVGVTARLEGRDLGGAIAEIREKLRGLHLPETVHVEFGGQYEQQQSAFQALLWVLIAAVGLVALVSLFAFGSLSAALGICLVALASLAGVFAALHVTGTTLNVSSYVGAIMMVGIVSENAMFVVHEARLLRTHGASARRAIVEAVLRRTRPVAMTVLATACALMPLAVGIGAGAQLVQPLAIAIIGGFTLSGPLVLFVLPSLYRPR
jgi:CzcA family heavy metal efflux pump